MTHKANLNQTLAITLLRYASQETFFLLRKKSVTLVLLRQLHRLAMRKFANFFGLLSFAHITIIHRNKFANLS
ncbi:MAG: hypothetical protein IKI43_00505 [Campylobacter sp.]|nr:hypothetical protein [Campylobacter sp.]MBR7046839.1 hypothetical protein [Campylobacter sp.]